MIRLGPDVARLDANARWALDLLVDFAALVPVDAPDANVVEADVPRPDAPDSWPRAATVAQARGAGWGITEAGPGRVLIDPAALALVAHIATARDEQESTASDRHERVPSSVNALVRQGCEREPVLHEAAQTLREAVCRVAERRPVRFLAPWPDGRRWAAAVTHDLDVVAGWPAFAGLRWAELVQGGHFRLAVQTAAAAVRSALGDPVLCAVQDVLAAEDAHGVRSTWFVLCGTPTVHTVRAGDLTYRAESPAARRILARVAAGGHEIGLHGSFATSLDVGRFAAERTRLARVADTPVDGVRQHFLRMRPGHTQRCMTEAGFRYDATFGFPDRNGFRLGAADVVPAAPAMNDGGLPPLDLVPLVWMDRALSKYRGVENPDAWIDDAVALATACREVSGLWTGLWHPNLAPALGYPGAPAAFTRLLTELAAAEPYMAPLGEVVRWRAARRAVRLAALAPDTRSAHAVTPGDPRLVVEEVDGTRDVALSAVVRRSGAF